MGEADTIKKPVTFEEVVREHLKLESQAIAQYGLGRRTEFLIDYLWALLKPYREDGVDAKWKGILNKYPCDGNPKDPTNLERCLAKIELRNTLLDGLGALFEKKHKGYIKKGLVDIWEKYPF